jgi:transposase-like protein
MKLKKLSLPQEEDFLSGPKIARKLDVDPATIRRWVREGAPNHVLGDKLIRFKLNELLAWRAGHRRK